MSTTLVQSDTRLLEYLQEQCPGRENAMPLDGLAGIFNTSWREVAAAIEHLRADGYLIGTSRGRRPGAFWPVTLEDQEAALRPYAHAFYRMSQVYSRLTRHLPRNVVRRVEDAVQLELWNGIRPTCHGEGRSRSRISPIKELS